MTYTCRKGTAQFNVHKKYANCIYMLHLLHITLYPFAEVHEACLDCQTHESSPVGREDVGSLQYGGPRRSHCHQAHVECKFTPAMHVDGTGALQQGVKNMTVHMFKHIFHDQSRKPRYRTFRGLRTAMRVFKVGMGCAPLLFLP